MLYFAKPIFLYLLLLVPLIPAGYGLIRFFRRKRIRKFGDETLVKELMPSWSGNMRRREQTLPLQSQM